MAKEEIAHNVVNCIIKYYFLLDNFHILTYMFSKAPASDLLCSGKVLLAITSELCPMRLFKNVAEKGAKYVCMEMLK